MAKMEYVLTETRLRSLEKRGVLMVCHKCEQAFNVDDKIITRRNMNGGRRYHKACWENMFVAC